MQNFDIVINDQRQISDSDSHEFTFLTDYLMFFFGKKVPAKGLDPANQALLNNVLYHAM